MQSALLAEGDPDSNALSPSGKRRTDDRIKQREIAFKVNHILLCLFLAWQFIVHAVGLFFFTRGFLLSRLVLDHQSQCHTLPNGTPSLVKDGCWHPRSFGKAVVIIIDALRYDFAVPFLASETDPVPHHYHNNLPILYNTAVRRPENAFLRPFIADPPTSTVQRLKALTAGNLPTFIDIGSSFGGQATVEDDLLVQLNNTGKKIVHLGDDTWHNLFPGYFHPNLTHPYDSLNVWDLHTVDDGVTKHLLPLLREVDKKDWDICFAHFLGVDHAGHRYGPDHPAMADKLQQMNRVLKLVMEDIDDNTLLVVMGDHGMDVKGDHGGESDDEVQSTLWMYSKQPRFGRIDPSHKLPSRTAKDRPVQQIDFVSTLSLLLGLPIPFNNLGSPIPEAFIGPSGSQWDNLAAVNLLTYDQMYRYQSEYVKSRELEFSPEQNVTANSFENARSEFHSRPLNGQLKDLNDLYNITYRDTIDMYRRLWTKFNLGDMALGIALSASGLLTLFVCYRTASSESAETLPQTLRIGAFAVAVIAPPCFLLFTAITPSSRFANTIYASVVVSAITLLVFQLGQLRIAKFFRTSIWGWLGLLFTVSQAAGFASNSYTIHEDTILLFFLVTFGVLALMSSVRQGITSDRILGVYHSALFILLTRAASFSRLCREEQIPGCRSSFYASQTTSTSAPWQIGISFAVATILPEIIKAFYKGTASYAGSAAFWIGFSFRIGLLFVAVYWTIDAAANGKWVSDRFPESALKTASISVARCALGVALPVGIGTFVWAKPCVDISIKSTKQDGTTVDGPSQRPQVTILGYANVFGSRYFLVIPIFALTTTLLLPPMGQYSMAIVTWQILCLLEILDTNRLTVDAFASESSSIGPVVLAMLGSYHFFKTGHQAVLSSIQWNSAFVPFRELTYPFAPLLVLFNTFGAQILCAAAVPLTVLWKRPVGKDGLRGIWSDVMKACIAHTLYYALIQLATTMWAGHLRRHLMLYRVFMPRFLMASAVLLVVDLVLIAVSLTATKISAQSAAEIFGY